MSKLNTRGIEPAHSFNIIDGKRFHCGQITRLLREAHTTSLINIGLDPHRQICDCFTSSWYCKAWLIDGKLAALGGVEGPLMAETGYVWLTLAEQATRFPLAIMREATKQLKAMLATRRRLVTTVLPQDAKSYHFAQRLGFGIMSLDELRFGAVAMEYPIGYKLNGH